MMRKSKRRIILGLTTAVCLSLLAMAIPATAETSADAVKPFAKHGMPGAQIVFTESDFTSNQIGDSKLTGILITGVPAETVGCLRLDEMPVAAGTVISRDRLSALSFVPVNESEQTARLDFVPVFRCKNGETHGSASKVVLSLTKTHNFAPSAPNLTISTYRNLPVSIDLSAYDFEGDSLTYTVVSAPDHGTLTSQASSLIYHPKANQTGMVQFQYYASDSAGNTSELATVTIRVEKQKTDVSYSDLDGVPLLRDAVYLAEEGVYTGRIVGDSRILEADEELTRGEFVALATTALSLELDAPVSATLAETCGWQGTYLAAALDHAVISSVRHQDTITGAEAAAIVSRLMGTAEVATTGLTITPTWVAEDASALCSLGILTDVSKLDATLTRGEAISMLARARSVSKGQRLGWAVYEK